ncbi:hypothetical protein B6O39_001978 [Salmonella enterica subsp. enterica serovar Javiana]|nr:hypothetical protein [Salmonella enterica subsp. enterica serovar Javiana]
MRMETEGSIPGVTIMLSEMINTIVDKEQVLAQIQQRLDECKEREARHADVQALQ